MTIANTTIRAHAQDPVIARAKGYPYPRPDSSFVYLNGHAYCLPDHKAIFGDGTGMDVIDPVTGQTIKLQEALRRFGLPNTPTIHSCTPILAIGSNASPQQLSQKYPPEMFPDGVVIPVVQCVLEDFDVVYAPTLAGYGSCPATLQHCPGTHVQVYITYLTAPLAQRMHATEGGYDLLQLHNITLHVGCSLQQFTSGNNPTAATSILSSILCYNHSQGCLTIPRSILHSTARTSNGCITSEDDHSTVAISEIPAVHRLLPALGQEQLLCCLQQLCSSGKHSSIAVATIAGDPSIAAGVLGVAGGGSDSKQVQMQLEDWILQHVHDSEVRRERVKVLRELRQEFGYEQWKRIEEL